jgi:hypothetical protein
MTAPNPKNIGRFARSIESGWLGKIIAVDGEFYEMKAVNELCQMIAGGDNDEWIDEDDTQWFVHDDLRFLKS